MSLLDWAQQQGDFDSQGVIVKHEFALLAKMLGVLDHPLFDNITIPDAMYRAGFAWCMPARFALPSEAEWNYPLNGSHSPDEDWLWRVTHAQDPIVLAEPYETHYVLLAHQVYYATEWGHRRTTNAVVASSLLNAFALTDDPDDVARIGIALLCLGQTVAPEQATRMASGLPLSWFMFHKHLTADYYRALKGAV